MAMTRQERLKASLKKEERRLDLNRLKRAFNYLGLASTALEGGFNDPEFKKLEFKTLIEEMRTRIEFDRGELDNRVQKG